MKKLGIISLFFLLLFNVFSVKITAQIADKNTILISQYFQQNKAPEAINKTITNNFNNQNNGSIVTIKQIGNLNVVDVKISANQSQTVNQFGNNNYYGFIKYYNNVSSSYNILQQGESNSLQIYGQNSLMNNISILQKGDFKSLIIKNY